MDKKNLLKMILVEAIKRNLEEMPQIKRFYTLSDDWEENAEGLSRLGGLKYQDAILKLESLEDMNFFNSNDIQRVFKFARPQGANNFINILLQQNIIVPVKNASKTNKPVDIESDDEFTVNMSPELDISKGIDLDAALSKIKINKNVSRIKFIINEIYIIDIPREEQRKLAVEYGSMSEYFRVKFGLRVNRNNEGNFEYSRWVTYITTPYKFLKPFLEKKYYKKIPSNEPIIMDNTRFINMDIEKLFPSLEDFLKFVKENPKSFPKVLITPKNDALINDEIENIGGKLVLSKIKSALVNWS